MTTLFLAALLLLTAAPDSSGLRWAPDATRTAHPQLRFVALTPSRATPRHGAAQLRILPGSSAGFEVPKPDATQPRAPEPKAQAQEEWVAEYVEYRCLPELGHITIADGVVRGRKPVEYLRSHGKELAARGIFPCTDRQRRRSYRRVDEVGGHKFETLILITPPAEDGADWTRRVTVLVDGRRKLDCSVGDSPDGEVFVYGVTIFPEDGTIEVAAVDADGAEIFPPKELEGIDHPGVITDDVLQPDTGEDEEGTPKPLERA